MGGRPEALSSRAKVALALATVYLVWGSTYLFIRWVVLELPAFTAGGLRFLVAGAVFFAIGRFRGPGQVTRGQLLRVALVGAMLVGVSNGMVALSLAVVPSSVGSLVVASMPLWLATFDTIRPHGQRPPVRAIVGLAAGFAGTAFLIWRPAGGQPIHLIGMVTMLLASMIWAAGSLLARGFDRPRNWMVTAGLEMMAGGVVQLGIAAVRGEFPVFLAASPSPRAILSLVYLIVIGSWCGYGSFSWLVRNARPAVTATYAYVNPLIAVILGATVAGEPVGARTLIAGAVIVGSVSLVTTARA